MAQISQPAAAQLLSKLLEERIPLIAFFRSRTAETRMFGFLDSIMRDNGLVISASGPPVGIEEGYIRVWPFDRGCEFSYGDKRELSDESVSEKYGESVLVIRFPHSGDKFALFFTL